MFRISKAEEQALRLIMRLAAMGAQQTLGSLAEAEELPEPTVAKLLGQLKRGGVVDAVRGRHGGYVLADSQDRISAAHILRCVASDSSLGYPCKRKDRYDACTWSRNCGLRPVWLLLEDQINYILEKTTVAEMLQKESVVREQLKAEWPSLGRKLQE